MLCCGHVTVNSPVMCLMLWTCYSQQPSDLPSVVQWRYLWKQSTVCLVLCYDMLQHVVNSRVMCVDFWICCSQQPSYCPVLWCEGTPVHSLVICLMMWACYGPQPSDVLCCGHPSTQLSDVFGVVCVCVCDAQGIWQTLMSSAEQRPWLWAVYVVVLLLPIVLLSICLCPKAGPIKVLLLSPVTSVGGVGRLKVGLVGGRGLDVCVLYATGFCLKYKQAWKSSHTWWISDFRPICFPIRPFLLSQSFQSRKSLAAAHLFSDSLSDFKWQELPLCRFQ